jgi:hypothetical protein
MDLQLSFKDMAWYRGIPYDLYDQDPEKWNKIIKLCEHYEPNGLLLGTDLGTQVQEHILDVAFKYQGLPNSGSFVFPTSNDYNSDKNIIISYPEGCGGNFLLNCLYFNDSSSCTTSPFLTTPKCTDISVSTLDNIEEKLNYIISETEDQSIWTDPIIKLNCKVQDHKILITTGHLSGIEDTLLEGLQAYLNLWQYFHLYPNCKTIIYYKNTKLFKCLREYEKYSPWVGDKSVGVGTVKQTILSFIKKSQETKKKLIDLCNDEDQVYSHCYIDSKITCHVWDTNWYFSEKDTIDHIEELYELLSLPGFNENAISKYYNVWIKTLDDLKTKALNETT